MPGRVRSCVSREHLVDSGVTALQTKWNVFEFSSRRCVFNAFGPVDAQRRVNRGGDVLHHNRALLAPSRIDDRFSGRIRGSNDAAPAHPAADHDYTHGITPMVAPAAGIEEAG